MLILHCQDRLSILLDSCIGGLSDPPCRRRRRQRRAAPSRPLDGPGAGERGAWQRSRLAGERAPLGDRCWLV